MDELVKLCGDVSPVSPWREEMYRVCQEVRRANPENFRDVIIAHLCFEEAHREFEEIKGSDAFLSLKSK